MGQMSSAECGMLGPSPFTHPCSSIPGVVLCGCHRAPAGSSTGSPGRHAILPVKRIRSPPQPNNNVRDRDRIRRHAIQANAQESFRLMDAVQEVVEPSDDNGKKDPLNNWVAIAVVIIATFMAVTKVKDDNIVQAMLQ